MTNELKVTVNPSQCCIYEFSNHHLAITKFPNEYHQMKLKVDKPYVYIHEYRHIYFDEYLHALKPKTTTSTPQF